jgi:hypothetical protein
MEVVINPAPVGKQTEKKDGPNTYTWIVGVVVGTVSLLVLVFLFWLWCRKKSGKNKAQSDHNLGNVVTFENNGPCPTSTSPVYDTIDEAKIQVEIKSPSAHFPDHYQSLQWKNSDSPGHAVAAKGNGSDISPSNSPGYEKLLRKVSNLANPTYGMPSTENIQTSTIPNEPVYEVPLVTGVDQ